MRNHTYMNWFGKTDSIYWHDTAVEFERLDAITNGAVGMTTNPFLIQSTLFRDPEFWKDKLSEIPASLEGHEKAEAITRVEIEYYAKAWLPVYEKGEPFTGFICAQMNPLKSGDVEYMVAQGDRYASWGKNVMLKIPATRAGLEAVEESVAKGYHVASTCSLSVAQVYEAAKAIRRGEERAKKNGITPGMTCTVLQPGRLDDYLRDCAADYHSGLKEEDIVQAGLACSKKAYNLLKDEGYDSLLLFAGFKSLTQITQMAGAKAVFTIPTAIVDQIPDDQPCVETVDEPVPADVIDRLMKLPEFRRAYLEDGMKPEEFITFGAYNRTIDQLINDGWNIMMNYQL